jgi:hypothetical protein
MTKDEPVVLGLPQSVVDELAAFVRDGRVVLSNSARNALANGLGKRIPMDRRVELRLIDDAGLDTLRHLRDKLRERGTLNDEELERLRKLRAESS